ncbi:uncharacterized protein BKCO1_20003 [Diplodia corticola]|uniref:Uncharacterized protein n=1 Tax=Diplodia corticola TaxID=236234 RepID=A0A1J9S499_9PEZI|nr:uncharacterized protein BKCO1_20003 [Diplodia corticola]OJD39771.1 hypothetical protein BKCO1_20003 [Diplodia corticola]
MPLRVVERKRRLPLHHRPRGRQRHPSALAAPSTPSTPVAAPALAAPAAVTVAVAAIAVADIAVSAVIAAQRLREDEVARPGGGGEARVQARVGVEAADEGGEGGAREDDAGAAVGEGGGVDEGGGAFFFGLGLC